MSIRFVPPLTDDEMERAFRWSLERERALPTPHGDTMTPPAISKTETTDLAALIAELEACASEDIPPSLSAFNATIPLLRELAERREVTSTYPSFRIAARTPEATP